MPELSPLAAETIGRNVRVVREQRDMAQTELAARVGIDRTALNHIESGRRRPNLQTLVALLLELRCDSAEDLLDGPREWSKW